MGYVLKKQSHFILDNDAQFLVYEYLKSLWFFNGYASVIARLVN
jgi:hypothetical protein